MWQNVYNVVKGWNVFVDFFFHTIPFVSQPHFGISVRMRLTLPKVGKWSPLGFPKILSSIAGVKSPCIWLYLVSLESSWSVDVQYGLDEPFGHIKPKLWTKEGPGVKLAVWLPTTKSQESTFSWRLLKECDMVLESSLWELQLWFRPRSNRILQLRDMSSQSPGTLTWDNFETPPWESREKEPFGCSLRGELQSILYGGRWWLPPSSGRGE
jgi:hypothetical protein